MPVSRAQLSPRSLVAIAVLGMLLLGGGIYFGVNFAVERAVVANAEDKAHQWTDYFLSAMPGLRQVVPKPATLRMLGQALQRALGAA